MSRSPPCHSPLANLRWHHGLDEAARRRRGGFPMNRKSGLLVCCGHSSRPACAAGVDLVENSTVTDIRTTDTCAKTLVGDRWYSSDSIVVCSGAWTGRVAQSLQLELSIVPIRGQMLLLKTDAAAVA